MVTTILLVTAAVELGLFVLASTRSLGRDSQANYH